MDRRHPSPVHFKPSGTIELRIGADTRGFGVAAEEATAIVVRAEDATAVIASVDDMVPAVGHPDAEGTSHGGIVPTRQELSIV